ncbi:MAG: matrixin family metalloprotease [Phycisphaerales bacterium]|nr:MAG: matrixin family metalloprotease [Phycisphaerales bacterium]
MTAKRRILVISGILWLSTPLLVCAQDRHGSSTILTMMTQVNAELAAQGARIRLNQLELYTQGWGQPENRVLMTGSRWVPYDENRGATGLLGDQLTYLVAESRGETASGLANWETESAIDQAMATWNSQKSLEKVGLWKAPAPDWDCTIFDEMDCWAAYDDDPRPGYPFFADIVHAGWYPYGFFECFGPGGGHGILGVSVTFIWVDSETGQPSDINGDNYLDTALVEIYYNDYFGDGAGGRAGNPWGIDADLPGIDVETVALHESGHALGLGHFGPPPAAVMNPYYEGIDQTPATIDTAGLSALYRSWPNP